MPDDTDRLRFAALLLLDAIERRSAFEPLPAACTPRDLAEAYAIQAMLQAMRAPALGPIAGWTIAGATPARARLLGLDEPVRGGIHAAQIQRGRARVRADAHVHLGVECEIAFELGEDVPPDAAPPDGAHAARFVRVAMPAFGIVDDRHQPYPPPPARLLGLVAGNVFNAGLVVGPGSAEWRTLSLPDLRASLRVRGRYAGESTARAIGCDPLDALAWLIRTLCARGVPLAAGTLVTTGALGPMHYLEPGEDAVLAIEGLGEVTVAVV